MLGTLVYMILDVSFNVLLWSSHKAIEGGNILGNQIMKTYNELNKPQMLMIKENVKLMNEENNQEELKAIDPSEPPSYDNTLQSNLDSESSVLIIFKYNILPQSSQNSIIINKYIKNI